MTEVSFRIVELEIGYKLIVDDREFGGLETIGAVNDAMARLTRERFNSRDVRDEPMAMPRHIAEAPSPADAQQPKRWKVFNGPR